MNTIIFCDIDDVLVDSKSIIYSAYKEAFARQNFDFTEACFDRHFWHKSWDIKRLQLVLPLDIDLKKLRIDKQFIFASIIWTHLRFDANLYQVLKALTVSNIPVILITSGSKEATELKLQNEEPFWDTIIYAKDKHSITYWRELKLAIIAGRYILIDDDPLACTAAKEAGFTVVNYEPLSKR